MVVVMVLSRVTTLQFLLPRAGHLGWKQIVLELQEADRFSLLRVLVSSSAGAADTLTAQSFTAHTVLTQYYTVTHGVYRRHGCTIHSREL